MCGIAGKVGLSKETVIRPSVVREMMDSIAHRGPDDEGIHSESQAVLGHRRLSIIDLSTGKQPISNEDGSVWIVYNGEIYNFRELREQLLSRGHVFKTLTDTEVIVHLYEDYGEQCVTHLRGMFAFAVWDARNRKLLLARDRVGIKPLYYTKTSEALIFASEIRAILADPEFQPEINLQAIDTFLTFNYVPGSETLLQRVEKLEPGHYLVMQNGTTRICRYWDLEFSSQQWSGTFTDAVAQLRDLLEQTVRDHMISDVPVGVLLSGGVDSTGLLSFAVGETDRQVKSFTIGFSDKRFADERYYADLAAKKFGTLHYDTTITARDFEEFLPKYVWHMEEPVCEPPAVALYYVTKLAKEHVKVLLSGEGGDEAFAGYQNYRSAVWLEQIKSLGGPWKWGATQAFEHLGRLPRFARLRKFLPMLDDSLEHYYYGRTSGPGSFFRRSKTDLYAHVLRNGVDLNYSRERVDRYFDRVKGQGPLNQMLYMDTKTWLPDDLLIKADKITMANSLELRVPLLDHKVLEFAASLPASYKVHGFTTKFVLKKAFHGRIPPEILTRRKTGFPVPVQSWFQNEMREFTRDLLQDKKTQERGYFHRKMIDTMLAENESGAVDHSMELFCLVTLELWHRQFLDSHDHNLAYAAIH